MEGFLEKFESFIGVNFWTALFTLLNFIILFLVAKRFLIGPVLAIIETRQKEIDDMYAEAESSKEEAAKLKDEYEEKLERASEESEEIVKSAMRRAKLREEEILREAREQAARTVERAYEQVELEKKRAINEIKSEVSEMAIGIASAVIGRDVDGDEHKDLIDSFIADMGDGNG